MHNPLRIVVLHRLPMRRGLRVGGRGWCGWMDLHQWDARVERPDGLVVPVGMDADGLLGPTRHQARGPNWRQTSSGLYVCAGVDDSVVEQRILEQGSRIRSWGAVTGWAALRWRGARFFEGMTYPERQRLPVPLITGPACLRPDPRVSITKTQLAPEEREHVDGIWVATAQRALFDELCRHGQLRQAVVDIEMVVAANLMTVAEFGDYLRTRSAWTGIPRAREALALAGLNCRTPQEVRMVLTWMLDADLAKPVCNQPIFDLQGRLIAIPDLLDVEAGVIGEYQGADHKDAVRHREDVAREQRVRDVDLECFEVVGGDLGDRELVVKRMHAARARARFLPAASRRWTLRQPDWWPAWAAARGL